ncbi:LuxR C-terminal-related transcriptional regulator [Amycolatopsis sp. 195334CR]|uniref:helix-turn-helix transcriptional regulator n=1 Tax=Amycolatopsis sp. 195334CR TaxID=2814588 RepID=UPI001F5C8228|nr:LuxR C-terminal-related transcriptional regulator [Amycolatopsis sp. 195334CR]
MLIENVVLDVDRAHRIQRVSGQFARWHEFAAQRLEGRGVGELLTPDSRPGLRRALDELIDGRTCCTRLPVTSVDTGHLSFDATLTCVSTPPAVVITLFPVDGKAVVTRRAKRLSDVAVHILEGIAAGRPSAALATRLHLSSQGVDYHVNTLLRRFGVPNRTALVARAYAVGALDPHTWPPRVPPALA